MRTYNHGKFNRVYISIIIKIQYFYPKNLPCIYVGIACIHITMGNFSAILYQENLFVDFSTGPYVVLERHACSFSSHLFALKCHIFVPKNSKFPSQTLLTWKKPIGTH